MYCILGVTDADKEDLIHLMAFGEKRPPSADIRYG
jgi:hypothetical protein